MVTLFLSMRINALLFQILFLTHLQVAAAYYLDRATCEHRATQGGFRVQDIVDAVDEGMNMIRYAEWRTQNNDPQIGDVINHMLGANGKQALLDRMGRVPAAVGQPSTRIQGYDPFRPDGTVEIVCEDWNTGARRNAYPGTQYPDRVHDIRYPNMRELAVSAGSYLCDPTDLAVSYYTSSTTPGHPRAVVLLCNKSWLSKDKFRIANKWANQWVGKTYDEVSAYLSVTFVHEFMHCLPGNLAPGVLPSGTLEKYDYGNILMLQDADKRANAEGFAKMAVGMWLRLNTMSSSNMGMGNRFTRSNRPGRGPHMYGLQDEPPPIS